MDCWSSYCCVCRLWWSSWSLWLYDRDLRSLRFFLFLSPMPFIANPVVAAVAVHGEIPPTVLGPEPSDSDPEDGVPSHSAAVSLSCWSMSYALVG